MTQKNIIYVQIIGDLGRIVIKLKESMGSEIGVKAGDNDRCEGKACVYMSMLRTLQTLDALNVMNPHELLKGSHFSEKPEAGVIATN